ncbi:MAG TPA: CheR family methyltransferase [Gemmatimonadales bacterium]
MPARGTAVVGLGASAGGLRALQEFFTTVPPDTGLSFVVVVHLAPDRESHLAELIQSHAAIPVHQVTEITKLEPNQVYVIPPNRNLSAIDSHLRLTPLEAERRGRVPVDHFFRTLAETNDGLSVGIILSGTGTDGADGVRHIREHGGLVIVQDPGQAEYDGMPRSAINTGLVDVVAPVGDMLGHILEFIGTQPQIPSERGASDAAAPAPGPADLLPHVLAVVRLRTGHDFLRYKRSTIARRITRRMQVLGVEQLPRYLDLLREDGREATVLLDDLLVNVTSFFRDPAIYQRLERDVIPKLFEGRGQGDRVRVWSVGCSTGEEAYSVAMLLLEQAARRPGAPQLQVFATDMHERSLRIAREGLYPAAIENDLLPERLERFFRRDDSAYRVVKELRDTVVFATHNLLQDPPFSKLDLIVCRNVLIYLQSEVQRDVIELFHYALNPGGYLLLGTAETLDRGELFRLENKEAHLYRRRDVGRRELRLPITPAPAAPRPAPRSTGHSDESPGHGALHVRMVERYAPPSLLVNQDHDVVHLSENAGRFLQHPGGQPTMNVFRLVREEFRVELRSALLAVREAGARYRSRPIAFPVDGDSRHVVLRVSRAEDTELEGLTLVIFDEQENGEPAVEGAPPAAHDEGNLRQLEAELELTRGRLQTMLEEFETSQEEMRASNEELQSANEELRSTMEELETSREELESINEELQTLNQENKHKVEELSQLSNDLQNLLQASDIATLFLDRSLRILRFTPRVSETFNVRLSDRGRPLADITHRLGYAALMDDARRVLQTLVPMEKEVQSQDAGRSYVVRITPYRTMDDRIEGVVMTLVDVTDLKRSLAAQRESEARFGAVADLVPDLLWESAPDGSATWFNDRWYRYTGESPADAAGFGWLAAVHPDDRERSRAGYEQASLEGRPLRWEARLRAADGQYRWFLLRTEPLRGAGGTILRWLGAATDIHEQRMALEEVERRVHERTEALAGAEAERRALRRQLARAEEDERRRLARELHDQLGQHLTAFALGVDEVRRLVGEYPAAEQRLGQLEELARSMMRDAGYLALELRPPELDDVGLTSALETYVEQWAGRYGVAAEVAVTGWTEREVPPETGTTLYRIAQEALTNVARHAGARRASVVVERSDGAVRLVVEDDGTGFPVEATAQRARAEGRLGLAGMRERAALLGGTLTVESTPGRGTAIYVRLPVEGE